MVASQVYVRDDDFGWLPASVESTEGDSATVTVYVPTDPDDKSPPKEVKRKVKLSDYGPSKALPLQNADADGNLIEKEDMRDLPSLHEPAILYNLKWRHEKLHPYTRVGDMVIAMNPFQWLTDLYSDEQRSLFADRIIFKPPTAGDPRKGLHPHIYEASAMAYRGLAADGVHQSILVSGESGSGKTETVKIIMKHLAAVQSFVNAGPAKDNIDTVSETDIVQRIMDSNVLLEAFGNAKTVRNDNSSRFGKYIQLQFDVEDEREAALTGKTIPTCILAGSVNDTYLLEKSRVVDHVHPERTYHIFYQILAAPDDVKADLWSSLAGTNNDSFKYVGDCDPVLIDKMTDAEKWEETVHELGAIGIEGDQLKTLMRAIIAVMQLGNLTFAKNPSDSEETIIDSTDELDKLADLLGVETGDIESALTTRDVKIGRETFNKPLKVEESQSSRDALSKEIYTQVFDWIVKIMNKMTAAEDNYDKAFEVEEYGRVGLLDIFGFESFQVNRFEQLCINYANEKLQQMYTLDTFRSVQEEYAEEDIELETITFPDNAEVLRLIEGRVGLIAVLNEECVLPNGTDASFVSKVVTVNKDSKYLVSEKLFRPEEFAVNHYAGNVKYDATDFVRKNMDTIPSNLLGLASKSSNEIISVELKAAADAKAGKPKGGRGKKGKVITVATKFRSQLTNLMNSIAETRTRYVRCIKPNPEKLPVRLNLASTAEQLRCAGVLSAIAISRAAFPSRLDHDDFIERYDFLSSVRFEEGDKEEKKDETGDVDSSTRAYVEKVVLDILGDETAVIEEGQELTAYACGKSRIYFRAGVLEKFEALRASALGKHAVIMQRYGRGYLARSHFQKVKGAAITIQKVIRRYRVRSFFLRVLQTAININCWVRCIFAKRLLHSLRRKKASTTIQKYWRTAHLWKYFITCKTAAIQIQRIMRGVLDRKYAKELAEKKMRGSLIQSRVASVRQSIAAVATATAAATALAEAADKDQLAALDEENEFIEQMESEVTTLAGTNDELEQALSKQKEENKELKEKNEMIQSKLDAVTISKKKLEDDVKKKDKEIDNLQSDLSKAKQKNKNDVAWLKDAMEEKDAENKATIEYLKGQLEEAKKSKHSKKKKKKAAKQGSMTRASFKKQGGEKKTNFFSEAFDYDTEQDLLSNLKKPKKWF